MNFETSTIRLYALLCPFNGLNKSFIANTLGAVDLYICCLNQPHASIFGAPAWGQVWHHTGNGSVHQFIATDANPGAFWRRILWMKRVIFHWNWWLQKCRIIVCIKPFALVQPTGDWWGPLYRTNGVCARGYRHCTGIRSSYTTQMHRSMCLRDLSRCMYFIFSV